MAEGKYKDLILETIDQLRRRKARPDLERIRHMLERKHGLTSKDTEAELEKLVDSGCVIKVDYKGSISYRNAAKLRKTYIAGHLQNKDISSKILTAFGALQSLIPNKNGEGDKGGSGTTERGVCVADLEKWLIAECPNEEQFEGANLIEALGREVAAGRVKKLSDERYVLTDRAGKKSLKRAMAPVQSTSTASSNTPTGTAIKDTTPSKTSPIPTTTQIKTPTSASVPARKGRPPKRMRFKKSHGPEFETYHVPPARNEKCDYCLLTAAVNRNGVPEELLVCKDCNAQAHPSCMDYSEDLARRASRDPWQCIDCKTCVMCEDSGAPDSMLFCDACDKGYHMQCHQPPIGQKPKGKWACNSCEGEGVVFDQENADTASNDSGCNDSYTTDTKGASCLPTPSDSPVSMAMEINKTDLKQGASAPTKMAAISPQVKHEHPIHTISNTIQHLEPKTDVSSWTIDDVVKYVTDAGFPTQAEAFKDQEIDGKSLLLIKRSDVLTGLSIRLGPALKIYNKIQKIQSGNFR